MCSVPIAVEREIYTALEDAGPEAVREMAGRELVITCRENDEGGDDRELQACGEDAEGISVFPEPEHPYAFG